MTTFSDLGFDDNKARELVIMLYRTFLERDADAAGMASYVEKIKAGASLADTIESFAASPEYRDLQRWKAAMESRSAPALTTNPATSIPNHERSTYFPPDYLPPGEAGKSYAERLRSGFLYRYCSGPVVLDVGYSGYDNPERKAALPKAIGVDLDYPGYDGITLPFADGSVDTVFSSHCLEHILFDHAAIRDWYRVLKVGGFIVCMVPSQALYERRRYLPSLFNQDHKRMYSPSSLAASFETALTTNSYRVRHLAENDRDFDYSRGPDLDPRGTYEIEIVVEKIATPAWSLA